MSEIKTPEGYTPTQEVDLAQANAHMYWDECRHQDGNFPSDHYDKARSLAIRLERTQAELQSARASWKCFHCGEIFIDEASAKEHFGPTECGKSLCEYTREQVQSLENQLSRYREDDGPIHQRMAHMEFEHAQALRRAEEEGYSKGLKDYSQLQSRLTSLEKVAKEQNAEKDGGAFCEEGV